MGVVRAAWPVASLCDPLQRRASQDLLQIPGGEASGLEEFVENCWKEGGWRGIHKMAETLPRKPFIGKWMGTIIYWATTETGVWG